MALLRRITGALCGIAVLSCILACGAINQAKQAVQDSQEIMQLGQSYIAYAGDPKNKGKGPADATEWEKWAKAAPGQSATVPLIQQCQPGKKYTFYWNVNIGKLPAGGTTTVLGYDNKLPGAMGVVVMADGIPQAMQPTQFTAATKPSKEDKAEGDDKEKDQEKK